MIPSFRSRARFRKFWPILIYTPGVSKLAKRNFSGMEKRDLTLRKRKRGGILERVMDINVRESPQLVRLPEENIGNAPQLLPPVGGKHPERATVAPPAGGKRPRNSGSCPSAGH